MTLFQFPQEECPASLRTQIIGLMRREWPDAFKDLGDDTPWPDVPKTHPVSFVLVENGMVLCHAAVPSKRIEHKGEQYEAFGLSEVVTHPDHRHQGLGMEIVRATASFMAENDADIGVFTCQPQLVPFYSLCGFAEMKGTCLVGGTRALPFRSDDLGLATMMRFLSNKALKSRAAFENSDICLELGKGHLWLGDGWGRVQ